MITMTLWWVYLQSNVLPLDEKTAATVPNSKPDRNVLAIRNAAKLQVGDALEALPLEFRTVIILREFDGFSDENSAKCLMKTILCFGDSNTWGYRPDGTGRFDWKVRWPGILQRELSGAARVIEEGLNARTTVFDDPVEGVSISRNGSRHLPILLETHRPIDLVIIFLGVNDLKRRFDVTPFEIAQGAAELVGIVNRSIAGTDGRAPRILLICPPPVKVLNASADLFEGAIAKSAELASRFAWQAGRLGCEFLDAGDVVA